MSKLQAILQRQNQRKERLQSALNLILRQLREMGALRVVLFGSLAANEVDVNSDIDLLVIMPNTKSGKTWWKIVYDKVQRGISSDIIVFNHAEFEKELPVNPFLREIIAKGRVVYEKAAQR